MKLNYCITIKRIKDIVTVTRSIVNFGYTNEGTEGYTLQHDVLPTMQIYNGDLLFSELLQ